MKTALKRRPAVAGQFYPSNTEALRRMIDGQLENASHVRPAPKRVAAIIAPHAGVVYSGQAAACAYQRVSGDYVKRVVLIGCSHRYQFEGAAIVAAGSFDTPLGEFPIDSNLAERLTPYSAENAPTAHVNEHALELQLPFLGEAVGLVPIVPILFGSKWSTSHAKFAATLAEVLGPGDLVVASTDLSHYLTDEEAQRQDSRSLDILLTQDIEEVIAASEDGRVSMCGVTGVAVAMAYALAKGATDWTVLDHRTSAVASGDYSRVVGYAAVSMEYPE